MKTRSSPRRVGAPTDPDDIAITLAAGFAVALVAAVVAGQGAVAGALLAGLVLSTVGSFVLRRRRALPKDVYVGNAKLVFEASGDWSFIDTGPLRAGVYDVDAYWTIIERDQSATAEPSYELQHRGADGTSDRRSVVLGPGQIRWPDVRVLEGERFRIRVRKPGNGRGIAQAYLAVRRARRR